MEKYIPDHLRKQCYFDWVKVRRCATNHIGDAFAMHLNVSRSLEDEKQTDEEQIIQYEKLMEEKFNLIKKELKIQPEEGEGEAEAEESEGEGETAEESAEESAPSEESADESTQSVEASEESAQAEEATPSSSEEPNGAEESAPAEEPTPASEEPKLEAVEDTSDNAIQA
jgi:hypothetical protein